MIATESTTQQSKFETFPPVSLWYGSVKDALLRLPDEHLEGLAMVYVSLAEKTGRVN